MNVRRFIGNVIGQPSSPDIVWADTDHRAMLTAIRAADSEQSYVNVVGVGGCSFQFGRTSMRLPRAPQIAQTTLRLKYAISVAAG
jgi:hypothetical protein